MPFDVPHHGPLADIDLLLAAQSVIRNPDHWTKLALRHGNRRCLVGALSFVCRDGIAERRLAGLLGAQLAPAHRPTWWMFFVRARRRLMLFNDHPLTSHADVMRLFGRTVGHLQTAQTSDLWSMGSAG